MKIGTEIDQIPIESNWNVGEIKKGQDYSWSDLFDLYDNLYSEYERIQEELEDLKRDLEDNYRPLSQAELIGYNERDFYEDR